ncbi:hypothetical protein Taro_045548, partial [Colocasia esculenta]|nr:hypothetical protein [Colocasia esculenta]
LGCGGAGGLIRSGGEASWSKEEVAVHREGPSWVRFFITGRDFLCPSRSEWIGSPSGFILSFTAFSMLPSPLWCDCMVCGRPGIKDPVGLILCWCHDGSACRDIKGGIGPLGGNLIVTRLAVTIRLLRRAYRSRQDCCRGTFSGRDSDALPGRNKAIAVPFPVAMVVSLRSATKGDTMVAVSWQWCQEVHSGTGVYGFPTLRCIQGLGWFCLWALDPVEVSCGESFSLAVVLFRPLVHLCACDSAMCCAVYRFASFVRHFTTSLGVGGVALSVVHQALVVACVRVSFSLSERVHLIVEPCFGLGPSEVDVLSSTSIVVLVSLRLCMALSELLTGVSHVAVGNCILCRVLPATEIFWACPNFEDEIVLRGVEWVPEAIVIRAAASLWVTFWSHPGSPLRLRVAPGQRLATAFCRFGRLTPVRVTGVSVRPVALSQRLWGARAGRLPLSPFSPLLPIPLFSSDWGVVAPAGSCGAAERRHGAKRRWPCVVKALLSFTAFPMLPSPLWCDCMVCGHPEIEDPIGLPLCWCRDGSARRDIRGGVGLLGRDLIATRLAVAIGLSRRASRS